MSNFELYLGFLTLELFHLLSVGVCIWILLQSCTPGKWTCFHEWESRAGHSVAGF